MFAFLTFFATVSLGLVMSVNSALSELSDNLGRTGIIQVVHGGGSTGPNLGTARKIITDNQVLIHKSREIKTDESKTLLARWLPSANTIEKYIPVMFEVEAKTTDGLNTIAARARAENLRFVPSVNAGPERRTGIFIMLISVLIFSIVTASLIFGIIHSTKNIIMLHRREIEILSNIGATPRFIAWQIEMKMAVIGIGAVIMGQALGWAVLCGVNYISRASKVGLLSNMSLGFWHYMITLIMAAVIMALIAYITGRTTLKILNNGGA